jgi:hypothetical protein
MLGKKGDFIGVCEPSQQEYYANICPNPFSIISISVINKQLSVNVTNHL